MFPMKLAGLALATSLSGINTTLILFYLLIKKIGSFDAKELGFSFLRIFLATLAMGLVCFVVSQHKILPVGNTLYRLFELSIQLSIGVISYVIFCFIFRVREMHELWNWLIKRKV
ncbi:MAG: polysaccharide biosynthesis C-terminal domain-containing protein, partial [Candidatus Omnitrophota bacterium]